MQRSLIVAISTNNVIGRDGGLPWKLSSDLRQFKRTTMGHALIMGRKTWESLGRPLPGRSMIVVSRQPDYKAEGTTVVSSLEDAFEEAKKLDAKQAFVIGGAEIYQEALPHVNRLYITRVLSEVKGDTFFPPFDLEKWKLLEEESHVADEKNEYPFRFGILERASK